MLSSVPLSVLQDWWTCIDFQTFYRKWNYVVYDWIHAYFYHDLKLVGWDRTHSFNGYTDCGV